MPYTNNSIELLGRILGDPVYSHSVFGEAFFLLPFGVRRLSGTEDRLNLTVSERLLGVSPAQIGSKCRVSGQIRSYNRRTESGSRLVITVFAQEFEEFPEDPGADEELPERNEADITGFICKPPVYRTTPFSREITDVLIAVNRRFHKSDYLPAIAWGRNARFLAGLPVGTNLHILGRLQSREYTKVLEDGTESVRTAFEISCSAVEPLY